ncbi:uncharacterized protein [Antedon mediterranea]|uniref:uncharacterized protein n=1 Tax=Antedon mediterranea TaxID=105859 RepID=UPI003AF9213B
MKITVIANHFVCLFDRILINSYAFKDTSMENRNLIRLYFHFGLNYEEIIERMFMEHDVLLSVRTLKRRLKEMSLFRRKYHSDILDVAMFIEDQINASGQLHGYRWMHMRCKQNGLNVDKETVRIILGVLDPDGVALRRRKRLQRRRYLVPGSNFMWHIDSYDKLKPYGICINGCIDGFSRRVIWLEANSTSSDPKVIAGYYIQAVRNYMGCPKFIRTDFGTENSVVGSMQQFLSKENSSFIRGTSQHNQRIESWWSILRKHCAQFWMNVFKQLKNDGRFDGGHIDKSLIQFCFMKLIQKELDIIVNEWNAHRIAKSRNCHGPFGRPEMMYTMPHLYGGEEFIVGVEADEIDVCGTECTFKCRIPCDKDVFDLSSILIEERQLTIPTSCDEGLQLYNSLRNILLEIV